MLTAAQDKNDHLNLAPNAVSGFNVNTIAIEVPIAYLTSDATDIRPQTQGDHRRVGDHFAGRNTLFEMVPKSRQTRAITFRSNVSAIR